MDDPLQNSLKISTETDQFSVAPGSSLDIPLTLTNTDAIAEQVRISIEGLPIAWVSTDQPVLVLPPGETRTVVLNIHPPEPPSANAGRFTLRLGLSSTLDPARSAETEIGLTVAGHEVKGRVGVLLNALQYSAVPGEELAVPVALINQGLSTDTFYIDVEGLPAEWIDVPTAGQTLEPGEEVRLLIGIQPLRTPDARAGRRSFTIRITSRAAPDQPIRIDCKLTVAAFTEFSVSLEPATPEAQLATRVRVQNLSNIPTNFQVSWSSPNAAVAFDPAEPQTLKLAPDETSETAYSARLARRPFIGPEAEYPYNITVTAANRQTETLTGALVEKGLLPPVAALAIGGLLLALCVCIAAGILFRGWFFGSTAETPLPSITPIISAAPTGSIEPLPTATQSQTDQRPLLIERTWYLVAYNSASSIPGAQEAFTRFNPDGTLIGFTGCKDLSGTFTTEFNNITIPSVNLGPGACSEPALQQQEDAMVAILRSARSYFVADTALQIAGDVGFLNYSLSPADRPEEVVPPTAVIENSPQGQAGQVVIFDGSASTGQVPLVLWRWDFGDGQTASGVIVQHIYIAPGAYNVSLTVTDQRGQTNTAGGQILILPPPTLPPPPTIPPPTIPPPTIPPPPTRPPLPTQTPQVLPTAPPPPIPTPPPVVDPPQAEIEGPSNGYLGEPVLFDASGSRPGSSPIVSYAFSFGNGVTQPPSASSSASVIYDRAGEYEANVIVVDASGLSSSAVTRISIDARLEAAVWTLSALNNQPLVPGTAITLQFLNGQLVGFAGCNNYNGSYTSADNGDGTYTVSVANISTDRRYCPAPIMYQETAYVDSLGLVNTASIQENMLILTYPQGQLIYYLYQQAQPR